ncbi:MULTISPECIES: trypco2 family protein [unclassified Streptomyces]|uniref:trypco2 family protein n=1 Tax=unclassified Streptomyces TaxID=2593676 RepID=UPI0035DF13EE
MSEDAIELASAVQAVRDELLIAASQGVGSDLAFELGDIQMEFTVELRREAKGGVKIRAWVMDAGVDGASANARTHKVAFTLKPKDVRTGGSWQVGNDEPGDVSHFGRGSATS